MVISKLALPRTQRYASNKVRKQPVVLSILFAHRGLTFLLDLVFISKILFLGQQVDLLQSWENTAVGEEVRRKHLRKMNCPETVTMWTEFIRQARAGDLEPRLPAHRLSNLVLHSGGKKARKRDVRLYLSYLLVAGTEEVGSDTEAEGQSSSDSE